MVPQYVFIFIFTITVNSFIVPRREPVADFAIERFADKVWYMYAVNEKTKTKCSMLKVTTTPEDILYVGSFLFGGQIIQGRDFRMKISGIFEISNGDYAEKATVIATDYNSYAVLNIDDHYSSQGLVQVYIQQDKIKDPNMPFEAAKEALQQRGFSTTDLQIIYNSDCPNFD